MKSKKIKVNEKDFEIKSAPLRKLLEALELVQTLPDKISELDLENEKNNVKVVAILISKSGDEVFALLEKLTGIPSGEISELDLADTMGLFHALLEVNDVELIKKEFGEISKMFRKTEEVKK